MKPPRVDVSGLAPALHSMGFLFVHIRGIFLAVRRAWCSPKWCKNMGVSMRLSKFPHWPLFAAFCFVPIPAFADFACPVALIFECTPVAGCQQVTAEQANLPPAVTLNVREKRLFSGVFGGEGLFEPGDAYEDPNVLHPPRETRPPDMDRGRGQGHGPNVYVDRSIG